MSLHTTKIQNFAIYVKKCIIFIPSAFLIAQALIVFPSLIIIFISTMEINITGQNFYQKYFFAYNIFWNSFIVLSFTEPLFVKAKNYNKNVDTVFFIIKLIGAFTILVQIILFLLYWPFLLYGFYDYSSNIK